MKRRTKIATILTAGLLSASLVGVGFAAWSITAETKHPEAQTGTVTADNVEVKGLDYTVEATDPNAKLGKKTDAGVSSNIWLDAAAADEDLELKLTITLNFGTFKQIDLQANLGAYTTLAGTDTETGGYLKAVEYTLDESSGLQSPTVTVNKENGNITFQNNKYVVSEPKTIVVKVTLGWGNRFGGENPYTFFNKQKFGTKMSVYEGEYQESSGKYNEKEGNKMNYTYAEEVLAHIYETLGDGNLSASFTYKATEWTAEP